ncbi:hypothetical protein RD1_3152 [Roseobacter denitrificans OCh 114]|uniref:Uncharacterized protein n=1 Tax=Roseobacter denitrificans (strain ATCC 33942 / OCh 114) TaxID=375451 RepID=Q164D3_ROSDO|nr:hypothetical protein RD1_3152 [Roseobacter denitrificans OCh 114]
MANSASRALGGRSSKGVGAFCDKPLTRKAVGEGGDCVIDHAFVS